MKTDYLERTLRNRGLISLEQQDKIARTSIAIAGLGGDGGLLTERLARFGIRKFILADPENFDVSNFNRQFASSINTTGNKKAEVIAKEVLAICPEAQIETYSSGISKENVEEFVRQADIIVDEIEFSTPTLSVILHQAARRQNKLVFMGANIAWGASAFCFSPSGMTFEEFFEYDANSERIDATKYFPAKPSYLDEELLQSVLNGSSPTPGLSSSVALVAAILSTQIIQTIIGSKTPRFVPYYQFIDLFENPANIHFKK